MKIFQKTGKRAKPKSSAGNATVVFVPSTRGSILLQSLKVEEDRMAELTGFRVKYQEAGGSILANAFSKNLGSGQTCGRADCPPCVESGGKVDCKARSIVYESKCLVCNPTTSPDEEDCEDQPSGRTDFYNTFYCSISLTIHCFFPKIHYFPPYSPAIFIKFFPSFFPGFVADWNWWPLVPPGTVNSLVFQMAATKRRI